MKQLALLTILVLIVSSPILASPWLELDLTERDDGGYFTLTTDLGDVITKTARVLDQGDSYIDRNNNRYEVVRFDGDTVKVELKEVITLPDVSDIIPTVVQSSFLQRISGLAGTRGGTQDNNWGVIGIYQTHNAESYVPTSGVESKDDGDIIQVGKSLANALEEQGFEVIHSLNSHLPHDGGAYSRSRRTVMEIMQKQPVTLIDVHRDATPPEVYETQVEGQDVTRVRIVVGRQNQNRDATLEYAKRLKAVADEQFPDLIEGIFDARGNYNQDVAPRAILLEFGAHTNPLDHAEKAAELFAKVIPAAAGISSPAAARSEDQTVGAAARRSIIWVLAIVALLAVGFVVLNKMDVGSLRTFLQREFAGKNSDDDQNEE